MKLLLFISAMFFIASCTPSVETIYLGGHHPGPHKSPATIEVFLSKESIPKPYSEIAIISVHTGEHPEDTEVIDLMKQQAAQIGCEAVLLSSESLKHFPGERNRKRAVAIRYK